MPACPQAPHFAAVELPAHGGGASRVGRSSGGGGAGARGGGARGVGARGGGDGSDSELQDGAVAITG